MSLKTNIQNYNDPWLVLENFSWLQHLHVIIPLKWGGMPCQSRQRRKHLTS